MAEWLSGWRCIHGGVMRKSKYILQYFLERVFIIHSETLGEREKHSETTRRRDGETAKQLELKVTILSFPQNQAFITR